MASRSTGWMRYNDYMRQKEKEAANKEQQQQQQQQQSMSIIYAYGETRGVTMKRISLQELKHDLAWVDDLFPEDGNELETYLEGGDAMEIKVKYVMFNSFMEQRDKEHRIFVYNKVLYGKSMGWSECLHANEEELKPSTEISPISYYEKFTKDMFDVIGI